MTIKRLYPWSSETRAVKLALKKAIQDGCPDSKKLYHMIMSRSALFGLCIGLIFVAFNFLPMLYVFLVGPSKAAPFLPFISIFFTIIFARNYSGRFLFYGIDLKWAETVVNEALGNGAKGYYLRIIGHAWHAEYRYIAPCSGNSQLHHTRHYHP